MSLSKRFRWFVAPSIIQAAISFLTLPLATLILGPADYGAYAVVASFAGLASSISCLGANYQLSNVFVNHDKDRVNRFVSQQLIISLLLSIFFSSVVYLFFLWSADYFEVFKKISRVAFFISIISVVPTTLWMIAVDIITLEGRARFFAVVTIMQSIISALTMIGCLFLFDLNQLSLYLSSTAGSLVAGLGSIYVLRPYMTPGSIKDIQWGVFKHGFSLMGANFLEIAYQVWERNLLAINTGFMSLGLYTHSQQYRSMIGVAAKALSRSVWPTTLSEAKQHPLRFAITANSWRFTHFVLTSVGLVFAMFGDAFIGLITNGKFVGAGSMASAGIGYLLVMNSGRSHIGYMYAHKDVKVYAKLNVVSIIFCFLCAAVAIPVWGGWGALLAIFIQHGLFRVAVQVYVSKFDKVPFHDEIALAGLLLISVAIYLNRLLTGNNLLKTLILFAFLVSLSVYYFFIRKSK